MDIRSALDKIVTIEEALAITTPTSMKVKKAFKVPPAQNQALGADLLPCVINTVVFPDEKRSASGMRQRFFNVTMQVFVSDAEADKAADQSLAFLDAAIAAFDNAQTLGGNVTKQDLRGGTPTVARLEWGGRSYIGLNLVLDLLMSDGGVFGP